jgi:hypothetical protein
MCRIYLLVLVMPIPHAAFINILEHYVKPLAFNKCLKFCSPLDFYGKSRQFGWVVDVMFIFQLTELF